MGTNYYAVTPPAIPPCAHCGRYDPSVRLHIGKSSVGWCFSLHVIPERGIHDLNDWKAYLQQPHTTIEDEYGHEHTLDALLECITLRHRARSEPPTALWLSQNHAVLGPNGLVRHALGRYCIGHGEGTWDLLSGDFS